MVYIAVTASYSNLEPVIYYNLLFISVWSISSVEFRDAFWFVSSNYKVLAYLLVMVTLHCTRVVTLIVATIYLQLMQNRYMFRSFTVLQCSHQHCVQPVASDVEVVEYL